MTMEYDEKTRCLPGDISFEELYNLAKLYRRLVRPWGIGTTSLAHDAYIKGAGSQHCIRQPEAWWKKVVRSAALSGIRKRSAACRRGNALPDQPLSDLADDCRENFRQEHYPMDGLLRLNNAIASAEQECPRVAHILQMKFSGLTMEQISINLGCSKPTATKRVNMAMEWLRGWIEGAEDEVGRS